MKWVERRVDTEPSALFSHSFLWVTNDKTRIKKKKKNKKAGSVVDNIHCRTRLLILSNYITIPYSRTKSNFNKWNCCRVVWLVSTSKLSTVKSKSFPQYQTAWVPTQLHQSGPFATPSYLHSPFATCTVSHPTLFDLHRHSTVITLSFTHWLIFSTCNPLWIFFSFFFSNLDRVRPILFDFSRIWDFPSNLLGYGSPFYSEYFLPTLFLI